MRSKGKRIRRWVFNQILIDGSKCQGKVALGDNVKTIADEAFSYNKTITSVIIPESVTRIGAYAFFSCTKLTTVKMSDNVKTLGEFGFAKCTKLESINLSTALTEIQDSVFWYCLRLERLTIPYNVVKMHGGAITECRDIKYITISNKVTELEDTMGVYAISSNNKDLVIYGISNSLTEKYAKKVGINFKPLALEKTKLSLAVGEAYSLSFNSKAICTWKSSDTSIAAVNSTGKITAKKKGKVMITATLFGKKYTCNVTVK